MAFVQPDTLVAWKMEPLEDEDFVAVQFSWIPHGLRGLENQVHGNWVGIPPDGLEQLIDALKVQLQKVRDRRGPPAPKLLQ